jgi:hypothetical protein
LVLLVACQNETKNKEVTSVNNKKEHKSNPKPPASFSDTITIDSRGAVFYYPDSSQLKKIKASLDTAIYNAIMHEYFYQLKNAHNVFKKYWPGIKVVEARNVRYLLFIKADKRNELIDLNTKYDPYGLFVFDPEKKPAQLELTNVVSEIGFYFSEPSPG